MSAPSIPQTVSFILRMHYRSIVHLGVKPDYVDIDCDTFEGMTSRYYKETHRLKLINRATSGEYRMIMTDHGEHVVSHGTWEQCKERRLSHADAINGTWFELGRRSKFNIYKER